MLFKFIPDIPSECATFNFVAVLGSNMKVCIQLGSNKI